MNNKVRKMFWDELNKPFGKINFEPFGKYKPKYLYRYRSFNENSISALMLNRLYFSTPNHYDDPFDTLIHVDFDAIENEINQAFNPNNKDNLLKEIKNFTNTDSMESVKGLVSSFVTDFYSQLNYIAKADIYSACFGEEALNENLWLKYADSHKGFVIEYKVESFNIKNMVMVDGKRDSKAQMFMYPIYYSTKPYDATKYYKSLVVLAAAKRLNLNQDYVQKILEESTLERHRICLIKRKCHSYDKEWRILAESSISSTPNYLTIKPSAIILGLKMSKENKEVLIALCKKLGIDVYETYISRKYKFTRRKIYSYKNE